MEKELEKIIADIKIDRDLSVPIYLQLKKSMVALLEEKNIPPGVQLPSLRKIGNSLSISFLTVSKTINEMVNEGLLKTVEGFGTYIADASTKIISPVALLLGNTQNYMYAAFLEGITEELEEQGIDIIVHAHNKNCRSFIERQINKNGISGLIAYGDDLFRNDNYYISRIMQKLPVVLLGSCGDFEVDASIYSDDDHAVNQIVNLLVEKKHKDVYYFSSPEGISVGEFRRKLFTKYADKATLNYTIVDNVEYRDSGYLNAMRLVTEKKNFSAIVCWTDHTASGVMQFLNKQGIKIPEEVAVVGYGNLDYADKLFPPLTTIEQNFHNMGKMAAQAVLKAIKTRTYNNPLRLKAETKLILRDSI